MGIVDLKRPRGGERFLFVHEACVDRDNETKGGPYWQMKRRIENGSMRILWLKGGSDIVSAITSR